MRIGRQMYCRLVFAVLWLLIAPAAGVLFAAEPDLQRYIPVSEISGGMTGYCLTILEGENIGRFDLKVLSIVRNCMPGREMILVEVTDPAFKDLGAVHGCSGSPVYLEGRLAGALAAGWDGSIKPLQLVTPIEYMLSVADRTGSSEGASVLPVGGSLLSGPFDIEKIAQSLSSALLSERQSGSGLALMTSLSEPACRLVGGPFEKLGFTLLSGQTAGQSSSLKGPSSFQPGGVLAIPLCCGDISMAVVGTVTEVADGRVYGFGHDFLGIGEIDLPAAAGIVHTVVATNSMSFKFASPGPILGTICFDRSAGVAGVIGRRPRMIDLDINVRRFDDPQPRSYKCQTAFERRYTPLILQAAVAGAALMQGQLPPEHYVRYKAVVTLSDGRTVNFANVSCDQGIMELAAELFAVSGLLLNNPFEPMDIRSVGVDVELLPKTIQAGIWSVNLSDTTVRPGQSLTALVTIRGFRSETSSHSIRLTLPGDIPAGVYPLTICGSAEYADFLRKTAPQRWMATDGGSLLSVLDRALNLPADRVYMVLPLPASGLAVRNIELSDLPPSLTNLLADSKRIIPNSPYCPWLEQSADVGLVPRGGVTVELTVEKP